MNNDNTGGYFSIAAWLILIGLILLAVRNKYGYTFMLYFLYGSAFLVLLIGSPTIKNIFQLGAIPATTPPPPPGGSNS